MPDVTAAAAEVGHMFLTALQNAFGLGPDEAVSQAQVETGVTDEQVAEADMGQVLDYMCHVPGLDPHLQSYLGSVQSNYNSYGNVGQSGSSYSGGGYSGGGSGNAQIVQQVTNNYATTEITDNHIDINGPVNGDIDIDQDNDHVDVSGDGNAVNTGEGDQNAATGDGSSAAQSDGGPAQSNSGDGAVQGGLIVGPTNTGEFTGNQTLGGDVENSPVGDGNVVLDNSGGTVQDSAIGFGSGATGNASNNSVEDGSAVSGTGDATGQNVDTDVTNVDTDVTIGTSSSGSDDHGASDDFTAPVTVGVEGGDGDQAGRDIIDHG